MIGEVRSGMSFRRSTVVTQDQLPAQHIDQLKAPPTVSACADALRQQGFRVCSLEDTAHRSAGPALDLHGVTLGEALDEIVRRNAGYRWSLEDDGLVNVMPGQSVLDTPLPPVRVAGKGLWRILAEDFLLADLGVTLFQELDGSNGPPIDLALEGADLRRGLNAVVRQLARVVWQVTGSEGRYFLTFTEVARSPDVEPGHGGRPSPGGSSR